MSARVRTIASIACSSVLLLATPLLSTAQSSSRAPAGVLLAVDKPDARIDTKGDSRFAVAGVPLSPGARVSTRSGGALIAWGERLFIALDDDSVIEGESERRVRLVRGKATIMVDCDTSRLRNAVPCDPSAQTASSQANANPPLWFVDVPGGAVTLFTGGEYELNVEAKDGKPGSTRLAVFAGRALLADGERIMPVELEKAARLREGRAPEKVRFTRVRQSKRYLKVLAQLRIGLDETNNLTTRAYLPEDLRAYAWLFHLFGSWYTLPGGGSYWTPRVDMNWRPYSNGDWVYTADFGWVWASPDLWAWATEHYGRWTMDAHGTWAWRPDDEWSASGWVEWAEEPESGLVSWCALGWDDLPALAFPYDRSRDADVGRLPRRGWNSMPRPAAPRRETTPLPPSVAGHFAIPRAAATAIPRHTIDPLKDIAIAREPAPPGPAARHQSRAASAPSPVSTAVATPRHVDAPSYPRNVDALVEDAGERREHEASVAAEATERAAADEARSAQRAVLRAAERAEAAARHWNNYDPAPSSSDSTTSSSSDTTTSSSSSPESYAVPRNSSTPTSNSSSASSSSSSSTPTAVERPSAGYAVPRNNDSSSSSSGSSSSSSSSGSSSGSPSSSPSQPPPASSTPGRRHP
jgi:hypothetical protein